MIKCSNVNCQLVKVHGQICCKQMLEKDVNDPNYKGLSNFYEPTKSEHDGNWYCSNFDY